MMFRKKSGLRIAGMMLLAAVLTFCPGDTVRTVYATQAGQTQGSDAYLKTFSASPGTISPDFSSMVTNYTITVSSDVDKLSVTCSTADSDAQVKIFSLATIKLRSRYRGPVEQSAPTILRS